jgi:predicted solute-binding protein
LLPEKKLELKQLLESSLEHNESKLDRVGAIHGKQIGLTPSEVREYLEGFNYRLGDRERTAMQVFRKLYQETEVTV